MAAPKEPIVYLTRCEQFSSAHRIHNKLCDGPTNLELFGKCNNIHGHNYKLEITIKGVVDRVTGMVMNIAILKKILEFNVLRHLDHKNIDQDVNYFKEENVPSTAENIAIFIWKQVAPALPDNVQLYRVKLFETEKNITEFFGFQ